MSETKIVDLLNKNLCLTVYFTFDEQFGVQMTEVNII